MSASNCVLSNIIVSRPCSFYTGYEFDPLVVLNSNGLGIGLCNILNTYSGTEPSVLLQLGADSTFKPGTNTWATGSDKRIKSDIVDADLDRCYEIVKELPLKRFKLLDAGSRDKCKLGWIAQEVEEIFPRSVLTLPGYAGISDFKTLDTDQIYAALFGAVKKLMRDVEELKRNLA
jgi:hypothetical protein